MKVGVSGFVFIVRKPKDAFLAGDRCSVNRKHLIRFVVSYFFPFFYTTNVFIGSDFVIYTLTQYIFP